MILTEEEIDNIHPMEMYFPTYKKAFARAIEQAILDKLKDKLKNVERYEWLREQHWPLNTLCVVENPRFNVKLGAQTYSLDTLDKVIDSAMENDNVQD